MEQPRNISITIVRRRSHNTSASHELLVKRSFAYGRALGRQRNRPSFSAMSLAPLNRSRVVAEYLCQARRREMTSHVSGKPGT